jgi:large subunit ribosomal protein L22
MLEARALRKNIHSSPRKMRLVIDLIRGKNANEALGILRFMPNHASRDAESVLNSAVKNLLNKYEDKGVDTDEIYVKEVYVNQGPTQKRMLPAPMGRAYRMRKRSNHLTIVVGTK